MSRSGHSDLDINLMSLITKLLQLPDYTSVRHFHRSNGLLSAMEAVFDQHVGLAKMAAMLTG